MATLQRPTKTAPPISPETQASFVRFSEECIRNLGTAFNFRSRMQEIDRMYQREMDFSEKHIRAKNANKSGDASRVRNVTVPVIMPQVESALTELSDIFLSSYPLFPVFSKPQLQDAALQMETIIGEQGVQFSWSAELLQAMRDALKYNVMAVECDWVDKKVWSVQNDPNVNIRYGVPQETLYSGNAIKRINPYNLIADIRVNPHEIHTRGEYVGYTELIGRIELKQLMAELDPSRTMNAKEAFESGVGSYSTSASSNAYFIPQVNPEALIQSTQAGFGHNINWHAWAGLEDSKGIKYSDAYEKTVLYARILPAEHKIHGPGGNTPQIWKLIIINRKVCIFAERKTNAHNFLPIIVAQATEAGLGWQDKSFADNAAPFQSIATALYNSGIESQRKKVYDRIFYDPSRINKADIDKTDVVSRIPIKSEAYGKPVSEAVYSFPYRDENVAGIFSVADNVINMADIANGQNRVQRGQFQKGNKTREEFHGVMDNSNARPRMMALVLESRFFTPLKQILKLNTLQFQPAGTLFNRNTKQQVEIDPAALRTAALEFRMADGLMPTDSFVNMQLFQTILQLAGQFPPMMQQWDVLGMIFYWLKLEGATWIDDFKIATPQTSQTQQVTQNATTPPQQ